MSKIDIQEDKTTADLGFSDALFRQLVEQSSDVTVLVNSDGLIGYLSPSVFSVLGRTPQDCAQMILLQWVHEEDMPLLSVLFQQSLVEARIVSVRLKHQQGHWVECRLAIQNFRGTLHGNDSSRSELGWYLITLHPLLPEENPRPFKTSMEAGGATSLNFLTMLSHELKTPLNAINGFAQLLLRLRRSPLSSEQTDMVQRILRNGNHLLNLINNLMSHAQAEAGFLALDLSPFDIQKLIEETIQELSSLATPKNLRFQCNFQLADPEIVNDRIRLRQILVNLLSNAIKFSDQGTILISVELGEPKMLIISVQDHGKGLASDEVEQIFHPYWQSQQLNPQRDLGTGLGLTICQTLATKMQGEIHVNSQLGQGTTFRLKIPQRLVNSGQRPPIR